jgi:hypothetical protein
MPINWTGLATSIAALSPIGTIQVRDFSNIPIDCRKLCPILFPHPSHVADNIHPTRLTLMPGSVNYQVEYTMSWIYLDHFFVGGVGNQYIDYDQFTANLDALYTTILANADLLVGAKTITLPSVPAMGTTFDLMYNPFHGCRINFGVFTEI